MEQFAHFLNYYNRWLNMVALSTLKVIHHRNMGKWLSPRRGRACWENNQIKDAQGVKTICAYGNWDLCMCHMWPKNCRLAF